MAASAITGCSAPASPPQVGGAGLPDAGRDGVYTSPVPVETSPYSTRTIEIDIQPATATCDLVQPKFVFDEARPKAQAYVELRALAECLQRPPNDRAEVLLVGRADPRGSEEYNDALSRERAMSVKRALESLGVAPARLHVRSAGEAGAVGAQPAYSYGYDRRVDAVSIRVVAPR